MKDALNILLTLTDPVLESVIIELYWYVGDTNPIANDIQLTINGNDFILGCAGDGSIFVKKGQATIDDGDNENILKGSLLSLEPYHNANIKNIVRTDNSILIELNDSNLEIVNDDDELCLFANGKDILFSSLKMNECSWNRENTDSLLLLS